jgi:hypothetical protein
LEQHELGDEGLKTKGDADDEGGEGEGIGHTEEGEEEEESQAAVDRVLTRYGKVLVVDDEGGRFDARYDRLMKEKMDEWKRVITKYVYVRLKCVSLPALMTMRGL